MAGKVNIDEVKELYEKLKSQGQFRDDAGLWKPKEGRNVIRVLPPKSGGVPWVDTGLHGGVGPNRQTVVCPRLSSEGTDECPICDQVFHLREGGEDDKTLAKKQQASRKALFCIIDRENEEAGPQVFRAAVTIRDAIIGYLVDPAFGDITDVNKGIDLIIERSKDTNDFTKYEVRAVPERTPLFEDSAKVQETLDKMPSLHEQIRTKSPERLKAVMKGEELPPASTPTSSEPTKEEAPKETATPKEEKKKELTEKNNPQPPSSASATNLKASISDVLRRAREEK